MSTVNIRAMKPGNYNYDIYVVIVLRSVGSIFGILVAAVSPSTIYQLRQQQPRCLDPPMTCLYLAMTWYRHKVLYTEPTYNITLVQEIPAGTIVKNIALFNRSYTVGFLFHADYIRTLESDLQYVILGTFVTIAVVIDMFLMVIYFKYHSSLKARERDINCKMLSYINHELRNPLHVITCLIDFIIEELGDMHMTEVLIRITSTAPLSKP